MPFCFLGHFVKNSFYVWYAFYIICFLACVDLYIYIYVLLILCA